MSQKKTLALVLSTAALAALALAGCSESSIDGIPANHFTDDTGETIEFNHSRCGGCHEGANRGNQSFEYLSQQNIIESFNQDYPDRTIVLQDPDGIIQSFNLEYIDQAQPVPDQQENS